MKDIHSVPVRLLATTPGGEVSVGPQTGTLRLPADPRCKEEESELRYGPYLGAVHDFLSKNRYRKLLGALSSRLGHAVAQEDIDFIEIRAEKHGASYHVARVDVKVAGQLFLFAVNVAASAEAEMQLKREFYLLKKLITLYDCSFLPHVYFKGAGRYKDKDKSIKWLKMFVAEWFTGFHEFHLHRDHMTASVRMRLWDLDGVSYHLSEPECVEFYRQAARILTLYYDWNTSKQIYPWHHAAGDFVLRKVDGELDVRLITVRDYRAVVDFRTSNRTARLLALLLFFLNLSFQLRLDRLDGVGEVAWAPDCSVEPIVRGFFQGIEEGRHRGNKNRPAPSELKELFRSLSRDEWLQLLVEMLAVYTFAGEEVAVVRDRFDTHLDCLQQVLGSFLPPQKKTGDKC